ncbi:MAG: hypothetical protein IPN76_30155 [Saprospiraceae bacterium]|nr:hypothetical protein [Saprospiraceae bacterium]
MQTINHNTYLLDFAIFCKSRPIDWSATATPGTTPSAFTTTSTATTNSESHGWSVLRFTRSASSGNRKRAVSCSAAPSTATAAIKSSTSRTSFVTCSRGSQLRLDF